MSLACPTSSDVSTHAQRSEELLAEMLMMSFFDLYNSAFRSVQSRASFVAEAGVKIFDPPNLSLPFQEHKDNTRVQFEEFAAYVKTHSLDTTEKLLVHFTRNGGFL